MIFSPSPFGGRLGWGVILKNNIVNSGLRWSWIAILVLILDRITKSLSLEYLSAYVQLKVFPGFNLTLSFNKGAAFSLFNDASGWQLWFFGVIAFTVSFAILIWLSMLSAKDRFTSISLSLIVGGALGNLWDRIAYGHVVDFIQVYAGEYYWPVFNIADSAVCVGAFMLFITTVLEKK